MDFKQRIRKHITDVKYLQNSACIQCTQQLKDCTKIEPFFQIYQFYRDKDHCLRYYKEK